MTPDRRRGGGGRGAGDGRPRRGEPSRSPQHRPPAQRPASVRRGGAQDEAGIDPELLVYGRHPVREAARGRRRIQRLHLAPTARTELEDVAAELRRTGIEVREHADAASLDALAGTRDHQGAVAEMGAYPYVTLDELLGAARTAGEPPLVLCLDQVTDPHNLGAIARVADASGATGLLVPEHRSARVTGAAVKASAGALEHVRVARCTNLAREIRRVKDAEIWAYAATERGTAEWTDVDLAGGALVVLGAEGPGIRPNVLDACDVEVRIPMSGAVASLNVATVAAILAFEAVRQRRDGAS